MVYLSWARDFVCMCRNGGTGRRAGLKIPFPSSGVWVRPPLSAPTKFIADMKTRSPILLVLPFIFISACAFNEFDTGTEAGMMAGVLKNVESSSFSVDPVMVKEDGTISNSSSEDIVSFSIDKETDIEVTVLDRSDGRVRDLNWDEFYLLWSQTDAYNENTVFDCLYDFTSQTNDRTGEEINQEVTIRLTVRP